MAKVIDTYNFDENRLFDALSVAVIVADRDFRIAKVNAAAESLLALSATKLIAHDIRKVFVAATEFVELVERALSDYRSFTKRDLELMSPTGQLLLVDCTVSSRLGDGSSDNCVIIELASVERHQRIQLEENILMQNQVTNALMRGLAHEVKNPLGGIRGAAQLLERELGDSTQTEYTQIIIGEADRLRTLVDKMLGPRASLESTKLNIHEVLERVCQLVEVEHANQVRIERDYDPSLPELIGDRDQLIQAFLNLVRNAVRASESSGKNVVLRSRAQRKFTIGDVLHRLVIRVDVIDYGTGVAPELADSIFFPMVSGHADGSGLGLPLAQSMINRQGGLIGFKSEPGHTEFSVWLPVEAQV